MTHFENYKPQKAQQSHRLLGFLHITKHHLSLPKQKATMTYLYYILSFLFGGTIAWFIGFDRLKSKIKEVRKQLPNNSLQYGITYDGHTFYRFKDFGAMPKFREMVVRLAHFQLDLGVKKSDLEAFIEAGKKAVQDGDVIKQSQLWSFLEMQVGNYASERILMQIAAAGIVVDGEPLTELTDKHNAIKEKALKESADVRAFFLTTCHSYLTELGHKLTITEVKELLKNTERIKRENLFLRCISTSTYTDLWNATTTKSYGWQNALITQVRKHSLLEASTNTTKS